MGGDHASASKSGAKALKLFWDKLRITLNSSLGLYGERAITVDQVRNKIRSLKQEYRKIFHHLKDTGNDTGNGPMLNEDGNLVVLKDGVKDENASLPYWSIMNEAFQVGHNPTITNKTPEAYSDHIRISLG
jgi:hypothetical protein